MTPTNFIAKIAYDAVGNPLTLTDARTNSLTNTWSVTRQLLTTTLPTTSLGSPVITNGYDIRDWQTNVADPLHNATLFVHDLSGRLILQTDPLLRTSRYIYDGDGRGLSAANAANETNTQTWNARGQLLSQTDGAGHSCLYSNDAFGNQIALTNRNSNLWQFKFDAANRLVSTVTPQGRSNLVVFNHQGLPAMLTDQAGQQTTNSFDARGRLVTRGDRVAITTNSYDANNNLLWVMENGQSNVWTYNANNRVATYQDVNGYLLKYGYDPNGNITSLTYGTNHTVTYAYDTLNRLTNVTDWAGRTTTLTYDLDSRLTSLTRPNGTHRTISYDAAGQLTNIWEQMANNLPIARFRFNWTNNGDMAWEFAAPLPHTNTPPLRSMTYDSDNRLATFNSQNVYCDSNGNLTNAPLVTNSFATYAYDARNRLLNAGGVTNFYDAINNRIAQTSGTNGTILVVNPNATLPQVLMRIKNGITNYYIYGAGLMYQVTETATASNTLTYHYDYRGSTIALSGDNGVPTDRVEYSLYGLTTYRAGTNDTPFLFNGQYGVQTDTNGLLYMRSRYYNPYLCRFINPDPSGFAGGLNLYAYAKGNPVSYADPFGLGALGESALTDPYFDAPTALQTQIQNGLTTFANVVTLGIANDVGILATGHDIYGSFASPDEQQTAGVNLAVLFIPLIGVEEGAASDVATQIGEDVTEDVADQPSQVLYHYTNEQGLNGITDSQQLNPSLQSVNPNDVRYGNGQYLSDIVPGTMSPAQLSRAFIGNPFQGRIFEVFRG